jgi:hypothetical protein
MLYDHFKHQIMLQFRMINFDAYFDNVITVKLIQTNVVLILHVNPLCCSNFMSTLYVVLILCQYFPTVF